MMHHSSAEVKCTKQSIVSCKEQDVGDNVSEPEQSKCECGDASKHSTQSELKHPIDTTDAASNQVSHAAEHHQPMAPDDDAQSEDSRVDNDDAGPSEADWVAAQH